MHTNHFFNPASIEGRSANMKTRARAIAVALAVGACFAPGVTVKFLKNTTNTPVVILATGDVTIGGTLDASGGSSPGVGSGGDGATGDDGAPGLAGPGGFDGGRGGLTGANSVGGTG